MDAIHVLHVQPDTDGTWTYRVEIAGSVVAEKTGIRSSIEALAAGNVALERASARKRDSFLREAVRGSEREAAEHRRRQDAINAFLLSDAEDEEDERDGMPSLLLH